MNVECLALSSAILRTGTTHGRKWRTRTLYLGGLCLFCIVVLFALESLNMWRGPAVVTISYGGVTNGGTTAVFVVHVPKGFEVYGFGGQFLKCSNGTWQVPDFSNPNLYSSNFGATGYVWKNDFLLSIGAPHDEIPWRIAYLCQARPPFSTLDRFRLRIAQILLDKGLPSGSDAVSPVNPTWVWGPEMRHATQYSENPDPVRPQSFP